MYKYDTCVIVGKFMPPHKGHEYMIRFAKNYAKNVHVIVDCLTTQTIEPEVRKKWIEAEIQGIYVHALKDYMPQEPGDDPNFWDIWKNTIYETINKKPDVLIAAMDYGWPALSKVLDCDFVPIDIARESVPISATMIRANPFSHWNYLMDSVKADYAQKFCFLGPESTGKSTIGLNISKHFNTIYVPEYAKAIIDKQNGEFFEHNSEEFAFAQISSEQALAKFCNKIMICDSSPITTKIYSELYFKKDFSNLETFIHNNYKHTFLFYPDTPYFSDTHRQIFSDSERINVFNLFEKELIKHKIPYTVVKGNFTEKEKFITSFIEKTLKELHD